MRWARVVATLGVVSFVVVWVWALIGLPDRVPVHGDLGGVTDRWGSRWELLIVTLLAAALAGGACIVLAWGLERRGWSMALVNIPHKEAWLATPETEAVLRERLGGDLLLLGAIVLAGMSVMLAGAVAQARSGSPVQPVWSTWGMWAMFAALAGWVVVAAAFRYRPPPRDSGLTRPW